MQGVPGKIASELGSWHGIWREGVRQKGEEGVGGHMENGGGQQVVGQQTNGPQGWGRLEQLLRGGDC